MFNIIKIPLSVLAYIFGKINWSAPPWLRALLSFAKQKPKLFVLFFILLFAAIGIYSYLESLPKPITVKAMANKIDITPNQKGAKHSKLVIQFNYDFSKLKKNQAKPKGNSSVAKINLINKDISHLISLSPAKSGHWTWIDDRQIIFSADTDWPAGTDYKITFDQKLFIEGTHLNESSLSFKTPRLNTRFTQIELYQDPLQKSDRNVVATALFSHPIDKNSFENNLLMSMRPSDKTISDDAKSINFTVKYDKNYREAYITSSKIKLPKYTNFMKLTLNTGVKSLLGGKVSNEVKNARVTIPDRYSFLNVLSSNLSIVNNQQAEPEQLLTVEFSDPIHRQQILDKLEIYLLPKRNQAKGNKYWRDINDINTNLLNHSKKAKFRLIGNKQNHSKIYSLILDVPQSRYIYIHIKEGLSSKNDYIKKSAYQSIVTIPKYPIEINIMGDGSVLSLSGQHKLNVLSRGTPALKYTIRRLLDKQITHLISQSHGDISNPNFNIWKFNEDNITELTSSVVVLSEQHPKEANYSSFDLSHYLSNQQQKLGLYFVDIVAWDHKKGVKINSRHEKRLILMTDLGLIIKNNANQTHDVFVQSIATGKPVAGATVTLLGKNGQTIFSRITSEQGHALIPSTKGLYRENKPTVFQVKAEGDLSFIPFDRHARFVNTSKFDVGGINNHPDNSQSLKAYLFSDRGIYRPGETVNLGMIVKRFDFSNIEDVPLELIIRNARNKIVKSHKFRLAEKGFNEYQYKTNSTSPTGRYSAALRIIRNNQYRSNTISKIYFKIEEFQPKTLKITSQLEGTSHRGWFTGKKLNAKVGLNNLFGTPAQNRKVLANVRIYPFNYNFKRHKEYSFSDPFADIGNTSLHLNKNLKAQKTDADGKAIFDIDLEAFNEGTYQLRFNTEGFDATGGRSVTTSNKTLISPLPHLIGLKTSGKLNYINKGSERYIDYIAINPQLEKINLENLTLTISQINTISTLVKQRNGTFKYQNIEKEEKLSQTPISINKTGYRYKVDTDQEGNFAIDIFNQNNKRISRQTMSVVGFANLTGKIDQQSAMQLKLSKNDYIAGELIEMSIKTPYTGAGLITIESDRVHQFKWFKSDTHSSIQTIKLPHDIEGNAYINVSFIRDKNSPDIFKTPLSYAIQPFSIDKSKRRVDIVLETNDIVRPGKPMSIKYSTSKPSRIAIFAINEGILQVARYQTPNPLGHFFKKRALTVETMQILDLILPDFDLAKFLSADGGGSSAKQLALARNLNPFARKSDKPAVYWSGIYPANSKTNEVKFNVPSSFSGKLRVMAVAVSDDSVGSTSHKVLVRGPFVISPNVLNYAAPNDEFLVTVGVANIIQGSGKQAPVKLNITASKHIEINDNSFTTLFIDEGGEEKYTFKVKVLDKLGNATLNFKVQHKNESSQRSASFSIRPATHYLSSFESGYSNDGSINLDIQRKLKLELSTQTIAASASPLLLVDGLSSYLEHFPHGCTEQVVSKVFPLVGLMHHSAYGEQNPNIEKHFNALLDKLAQRQQNDGGFSFWPGATGSAHYPTIYAMHFLLDAKEKSFTVPSNMLQRGQQYLSFAVQQPAISLLEARNKANAIYLLTRMGMVTSNHLIDLEENLRSHFKNQWQQDILSSYMAATYQLLQKDKEANRLIEGYKMSNQEHRALNNFHSALSLDAQYVYLLAKHFEQKAKDLDIKYIHQFSELIYKGEYNTLSAAYSILALGAYSELVLNNEFNENISFMAIDTNNQKSKLNTKKSPFLKADYTLAQQSLLIEAKQALFYLNIQSGYDDQLPTKAVANGIEVYREFLDDQGNEVNNFVQGQEIIISLKIRALKDKKIDNIALIDILPAGFEVIRSSLSADKLNHYGFPADYIDIREDRVVIYGSFSPSLRTIKYKAKMTASGQFVVPPLYAESMYDRSIYAHSKADKINIMNSQ